MSKPFTPVIFRIEAETGQPVAIFPTLPAGPDPYTATCYAHVGQHSSCTWGWYINRTRRPRDTERKAVRQLWAELKSLGYTDLALRLKWTAAMDEERRRRLAALPRGAVVAPGLGNFRGKLRACGEGEESCDGEA